MKSEDLAELIRFLRESSPGEKGDGLQLGATRRRDLARELEQRLAGEMGSAAAGAEAKAPGGPGPASSPPAARALPPDARALLRCDGASRGNPGPAALGFVIGLEGEELYSHGETLGTLTNNQAEYHALLAGLEAVRQLGFTQVDIALDSELVVRQIEGRYKVKNEGLKPLHARALAALAQFSGWSIRHVPRAENAAADALANEALGSL